MPIIAAVLRDLVEYFEMEVSRAGKDAPWQVKTTPHFCKAHRAAQTVGLLEGLSSKEGGPAKIVFTVSRGTPPHAVFERSNVEGAMSIDALMGIAKQAFTALSMSGPIPVVLCADDGPPSSRLPTMPAPPDPDLN